MTTPPITDHVFRPCADGHARNGRHGGTRVDPRMCYFLGRCNRPQADHIAADDYRRKRGTA